MFFFNLPNWFIHLFFFFKFRSLFITLLFTFKHLLSPLFYPRLALHSNISVIVPNLSFCRHFHHLRYIRPFQCSFFYNVSITWFFFHFILLLNTSHFYSIVFHFKSFAIDNQFTYYSSLFWRTFNLLFYLHLIFPAELRQCTPPLSPIIIYNFTSNPHFIILISSRLYSKILYSKQLSAFLICTFSYEMHCYVFAFIKYIFIFL